MWYTQDEWGRFAHQLESVLDKVNELLLLSFNILNKNFSGDNDFDFFCGYMISQFPEFFESIFDGYMKAKSYGDNLLNKAYMDKFCLALILKNSDNTDKYILESGENYLRNNFKIARLK